MAEMTLPQVYRRAVELLERVGWTQDKYRAPNGCLCATGALALALGGRLVPDGDNGSQDTSFDDRATDRLWSDACRTAGAAVGRGAVGDIVDWNDEPGRTADEVKALFLRLAEEADRG